MYTTIKSLKTKVMNKTILILLFLCGSFTAWSQTIRIDTVEIIPVNPVVTDSVKVGVHMVSTLYSIKNSDSLSITGDTIHIYYCISISLLTSVTVFTDTFALGTLAAGDYTVRVKAYETMDTTCNNPGDSVSASTPFTVTGAVSVDRETPERGFSIHLAPNPAESFQQVVITTEKPENMTIQLFDLSGRLVRDVFSGEVEAGEQSFTVDLTGLKSGTYVCKVLTDNNMYHLKAIKQ